MSNKQTLYDKLEGPGPDLSRYREGRTLDENEQRFLEAFFGAIKKEAGCFSFVIKFIVIALAGGGWVYGVLINGLESRMIIVGLLFLGVAWFGWKILLPITQRHQDTRLEPEKPLLLIEGRLRMDLRATGVGTKVYLDDVPVSVPTRWPKLYPSYVSAEVYVTNSGQHLIVSMRYNEEHRARQAADEYRRKAHGYDNGGHFSIAEDLERGKLEMGKKVYQLYG